MVPLQSKTLPRAAYGIGAEESKRIQILRVWLTVMVLFWHADEAVISFSDGDILLQAPAWLETAKYLISHIIVRCSVPGFFFISAILLFRREFDWADNVRKKLRTLIAPYFILNAFWIAAYFVAQKIPVISGFFGNESKIIADWGVVDYIDGFFGILPSSGAGSFYSPFVSPLWFLRDLFVLNLIAPLLKKAVDRFPKAVLVLLALVYVLDIQTGIFCLSSSALVYFCLGYYSVKYQRHLCELDRIPAPVIALLYAASIGLFCLMNDRFADEFFRKLTVIFGFCFFFRFATVFRSEKAERRLLKAAGYSFAIYLFHEPAMGFLQKIGAKLLPDGAVSQALIYFGAPVITFFACLVFAMLFERLLPKLYSAVTGGRSGKA